MANNEHQYPVDREEESNDSRDPYWRRAHHDWWFLILVILILAALAAYVLNLDLSMMPRSEVFPLLDLGNK
jgi:hypothetical protein